MLELTDAARKELEAFFADKKKETIRIYAVSSCGGPRLALALDEANDQDQTEEQGGFTFCISKELLEKVQGVKIDLTYMGFAVEPEVPVAAEGGSACGSCCGSCGTH